MKTYKIQITFSSEPKNFWKGNISRYYFAYLRGSKVGLCGSGSAKQYVNYGSATKMCDRLHEIYPDALVKVLRYNNIQAVEIGIEDYERKPETK